MALVELATQASKYLCRSAEIKQATTALIRRSRRFSSTVVQSWTLKMQWRFWFLLTFSKSTGLSRNALNSSWTISRTSRRCKLIWDASIHRLSVTWLVKWVWTAWINWKSVKTSLCRAFLWKSSSYFSKKSLTTCTSVHTATSCSRWVSVSFCTAQKPRPISTAMVKSVPSMWLISPGT